MAEKIGLIQAAEADFVCSQLPLETARWLYEGAGPSRVLSMPHALNPAVYCPEPGTPRAIDIGFIGDLYHNQIGDMERTNLVRYFERHGHDLGLSCDIRAQRLPRDEWAGFLRACKAILGAESGTYFLDRTGEAVARAEAYSRTHPAATFDEVYANSFGRSTGTVSGKAISPRHFEAIGTKTCQVLIEGEYNGILVADEHYVSVKKDLASIEDAVRRFRDEHLRHAMVERAFEYVMAGHTYRHRVESLLRATGLD
ncbi:MAG TPA: glycosyltransferase [Anaerolineae bacterium]|nr:glycosyltransferase [Anaerolineae bacterium]HPL26480.1 glycosyltransferase [Anaerolineae bacterium]